MKLINSIILLLLPLAIFAQQDAAAEPFLEKIKKDLEPGLALDIAFDYMREDHQTESSIEGDGTLMLFGEKYKMELGDAIIYFDGEKQYSVNLEIEEAYISIPDPENKEFMFSDPIRLLKTYKHEFKYRFMGDASFMGVETQEIQLYPKELGGPYALIKLYISKANDQLKGIIIRQKDGIVYSMIVTSWDTKEDPGIDYFRFKQEDNPNIDIIELLN